MTLIRELIDIPEQVHRGDFVLRLAEGVAHPRETLRDYVVTEQLVACFDNALGFIRSALESRSSKAAYLHGSFGSGKSHFMAVLHLLLQHDAEARSIRELAPVVDRHGGWLEGKRFLLVPYHMIGARSMESAILGGYVAHIRRLHPEAPIPGVYLAERIFEDARQLRARLGDEAFFAALGGDRAAGAGEWGVLAAGWDAASFETALTAPARSEERTRLVGDLVTHFFTAYRDVAAASEEAFVPLDDGLAILSRHAQGLGYDAVVLFLDELILWLASHVADLGFVSREGQKLAKLVEAAGPGRPVPLVSFVARQRDLRELVGDHLPGAERLGFADVLKWWEGRFHTITLEDRNLPAIAERRVLRPRSEAARQQLDRAFEETRKVREEVMQILLTREADQGMFRAVYPFSPALVQTLVAVSSVLQRERTALKVMLQLLVNQRETLRLGDLVPVGDLFDVIAEGDEPFTEDMRVHFENARRLYYQRLLPLLEREHGLRAEEVRRRPPDDAQATAFRGDDRIVKTLLLAALAPSVESLRALTATRLAALNHGTIRSPIPGREGTIVLGKCRKWAAQVGEIKIGEDPASPTIAVQITGVDTESIVEKARIHDNLGNRRLLIRRMLFRQLEVREADTLFLQHPFSWRGTRRGVDVVIGNARELPEESLRASGLDWRMVIGFPLDAEGHGPADNLARIEQFRSRGETSRTLCWVAAFLTPQALRDLGTLVVLDHILAGERFRDYASHLSQVEQASARALLDNQRSQLEQRILACLEGAYGVATPPPGTVDASHEVADRLQSLDAGWQPLPPVGASLGAAFQHLLGQMLAHQFPAHPPFEVDVRPGELRRVWEQVQRAAQAPQGRIIVEREARQRMRQIANPLRLGEMHEDAFILGHHWRQHFLRKAAEDGGAVTVAKLRRWTDEPAPAGLTKEVQNLVILTFAEQTSQSFFLHGGPAQGAIESLPDELELRPQRLPPPDQWEVAQRHGATILGIAAAPALSASSMARLEAEAQGVARDHRAACSNLIARLRERMARLGLDPDAANRHRTAAATLALVEAIHAPPEGGVVAAIARARVETSAEAMATSLRKAASVATVLDGDWIDLLQAVAELTDERAPAAAAIRRRVIEALERDELAVALEPAIRAARTDALRLITKSPAPPPEPPPPAPGVRVVEASRATGLDAERARALLRDLERKVAGGRDRRLSVDWRIEEPESSR